MMHKALSSRWLRSALGIGERSLSLAGLPAYLCPAVGPSPSLLQLPRARLTAPPAGWRRCLHAQAAEPMAASTRASEILPPSRQLPPQCTGCGAFSQTQDKGTPGYYDRGRKAVRRYLGEDVSKKNKLEDVEGESQADMVVQQALRGLSPEQLEKLGLDPSSLLVDADGKCRYSLSTVQF
jgi:genetic interactor of prohibitins 3, mitochondrial